MKAAALPETEVELGAVVGGSSGLPSDDFTVPPLARRAIIAMAAAATVH